MTGERLLKRILVVLAGTVLFLLFAAVVRSDALPIRPDLKKVLAQPVETPARFVPARAGWDGPEMPRSSEMKRNATLESLGPAATARAARASLVAAAIPDYRAVAGIALVILLLRRIRKTDQRRKAALAVMPHPAGAVPSHSPSEVIEIERVA